MVNKSQVRFIVGKGGVGKTTLTAAIALAAAALGRRVQMIELEGRSELARSFDTEATLGPYPTALFEHESGATVVGRHLAPDAALLEWMSDHGFGRLLPRLRATGAVDIIATAVPGIRDVLILGKIKAIARENPGDLILIDAPATGHSLSLLASPGSLMDATRTGPIRRQADEVAAMLRDEDRCCVSLVTIPAELPVTEAIEAAYTLEDRAGVALSTVFVNQYVGSDPALREPLSDPERWQLDASIVTALERARRFTLAKVDEEERQRRRLASDLPLPQMIVPHVQADTIGLEQLFEIATALLEDHS